MRHDDDRPSVRQVGNRRACDPMALLLAAIAAVWHALLMTSASNDNFLHMTLTKQWLAGDWPVRDFFDQASILQAAMSAAAQAIGGDRLLSEALVVGLAWGVSAYCVVIVVRSLTGYPIVAGMAAFLVIASGARGYSYPKGIVYAVAVVMWWRYVRDPTTSRILLLGAWTAVAFYWRADHGLYIAIAIALACVAAHGPRRLALSRCLSAGAVAVALVAPFLAYVHGTVGLPQHIQTGVAAARTEHVTQGPHEWPLLRLGGNVVDVEPADRYAPTIGLRWRAESSTEERRQLLERYQLSPLESDDGVARVLLSRYSIANIRRLINEPLVDDTAGVDRASGTLAPASWPAWQRWKFEHAWLRVRVLPGFDSQARASEIAVATFYLLPIAMMVTARRLSRHLRWASAGQLVAFAVFALLVDLAMLRLPFAVRAPDAVVLSAVVFGCCLAGLWREASTTTWFGRALYVLAAAVLASLVIGSVTTAGRFGERFAGLVGQGVSFQRARDAWRGAYNELVASPPLGYYVDNRARFSLRLAAYVRACVPATDRLLILWFEPEIYYYADRLMAQRHLVFAAAWARLAHEQRLTLDKIKRYSPPIAIARRSALDDYARASYPGVVDYVEREYRLHSSIVDQDEEYLVFARRDRPILGSFGHESWPCFVREGSVWSRVGLGT